MIMVMTLDKGYPLRRHARPLDGPWWLAVMALRVAADNGLQIDIGVVAFVTTQDTVRWLEWRDHHELSGRKQHGTR